RNLLHRRVDLVVHQAGNRKRLSTLQLELGLSAPCRECRNSEAVENHRVGKVERADLWANLQVNAVARDDRREVQPDTKFFELNADRDAAAAALGDWNGKLAAGQEAGFLAAFRHEIGIG